MRVKNPKIFHNGVRVRVLFRNGGTRVECDVVCNLNSTKNENCDSHVLLHEEPSRSMESIFTSEPAYLQWLGWKVVGHPSEWQFKMPYLSFYC